MSTTPTPINAGQKATLSPTGFVDGAGNPVTALPAGAKVGYSASNVYLAITENADNVSCTVQAGTPPSQGTLATVTGVLSFTDQYGTVHTETASWQYSVNFDPGVITSFALNSTTPA